MKYISLIALLLLVFVHKIHAQGLTLSDIELTFGNTYSSFQFKNSAGEKVDNYQYAGLNNLGVNFNLTADRHVLRPSLGMRQGGAKTTIEGIPVDWKLNYIDLSFGYLYKALKTDRLELSPGLALYGGYLLNGDQTVGDMRFPLAETEAIKPFDFGVQGIVNARYNVNDFFAVALEYRYGYGIAQIENDIKPQTANNVYHGISLGLAFTLKQPKNKPKMDEIHDGVASLNEIDSPQTLKDSIQIVDDLDDLTENNVTEMIVNDENNLENTKAKQEETSKEVLPDLNQNQKTENVEIEKQQKISNCKIITGSFSREDNTNARKELLEQLGYSVFIEKNGNMTRVGVFVSCENNIIQKELNTLRSKVASSAWVLKEN